MARTNKQYEDRLAEVERLIRETVAERRLEAEERRKAAAKEAEERREAAKFAKEQQKAAAKEAEDRRKAEAKFAKEQQKAAAKFDAQLAKWRAESEAEWRKIRENIGGFTQGAGEILEQEYIAAIRKEKRIGDIVIDDVYPNLGDVYEYDGVFFDAALMNGKFAVVLEVKHRFTPADVRKFAKDRLPRFAATCPVLARGRKILGAIGGGSTPPRVVKEAEKQGLFVLGLRNRELVVKSDKGVRAI